MSDLFWAEGLVTAPERTENLSLFLRQSILPFWLRFLSCQRPSCDNAIISRREISLPVCAALWHRLQMRRHTAMQIFPPTARVSPAKMSFIPWEKGSKKGVAELEKYVTLENLLRSKRCYSRGNCKAAREPWLALVWKCHGIKDFSEGREEGAAQRRWWVRGCFVANLWWHGQRPLCHRTKHWPNFGSWQEASGILFYQAMKRN